MFDEIDTILIVLYFLQINYILFYFCFINIYLFCYSFFSILYKLINETLNKSKRKKRKKNSDKTSLSLEKGKFTNSSWRLQDIILCFLFGTRMPQHVRG